MRSEQVDPSSLSVRWVAEDGAEPTQAAPFGGPRRRIERAGARWAQHDIEPITACARTVGAWNLIEAHARQFEATHVVATGDGAIVHPLRESLGAAWQVVTGG